MVQFPGSTDGLVQHGRVVNQPSSPPSLWRCPACAGKLTFTPPEGVECAGCHAAFASVDGIPDLRAPKSSRGVDPPDLAEARALSSELGAAGAEAMITGLFTRRGWDADTTALRVRQTLASPNKLRP